MSFVLGFRWPSHSQKKKAKNMLVLGALEKKQGRRLGAGYGDGPKHITSKKSETKSETLAKSSLVFQ